VVGKKLTIVIGEASLETVPRELWSHPAIYKYAKRRGKQPGQVLLDHAVHHQAMKGLPNAEKRGRPDIVHLVMLEVLSSALNVEGLLQIYVHTVGDYVIEVDPSIRLPRNYMLFTGLIEQLFEVGQVPPDSPKPLMKVKPMSLARLLEKTPRPRILVTYSGDYMRMSRIAEEVVSRGLEATLVLPGFPAVADFSDEAYRYTDLHVRPFRRERLDPWTIASHILALIAYKLEVI
jgi:rRNA small subunit pseudouridine methyltransferase Nep1